MILIYINVKIREPYCRGWAGLGWAGLGREGSNWD